MKAFFVIFITCLVTAGLVFGGGYLYLKAKPDQEKQKLESQRDDLQKEADTLKATSDVASWKKYDSKELGLSFKYPSTWGEPLTHSENYSDPKGLNNPYFAGQYFSVCFGEGEYCAIGYSKDYKVYESAGDSYYVGDKTNLDAEETGVALDAKKATVSFVQKATVANVKTSSKTVFYYLSEASGVGVSSQTFLNGKATYPGIVLSTYYESLSESLKSLYDANTDQSVTLNNKAKEELEALKSTKSKYQAQFDLYETWLATFSYL